MDKEMEGSDDENGPKHVSTTRTSRAREGYIDGDVAMTAAILHHPISLAIVRWFMLFI